jgi:hypothetical protein
MTDTGVDERQTHRWDAGSRGTWHMHDHVPIIKRLRWGTFGYANLRYTPGKRLDWLCGDRTTDWPFRELSCNWVGLRLRPRGVPPRKASTITQKNRDEWKLSIELNSVRRLSGDIKDNVFFGTNETLIPLDVRLLCPVCPRNIGI